MVYYKHTVFYLICADLQSKLKIENRFSLVHIAKGIFWYTCRKAGVTLILNSSNA